MSLATIQLTYSGLEKLLPTMGDKSAESATLIAFNTDLDEAQRTYPGNRLLSGLPMAPEGLRIGDLFMRYTQLLRILKDENSTSTARRGRREPPPLGGTRA